MDADELKGTKLFQSLLRDRTILEEEWKQFNSEWTNFWARNSDHIGRVLIAHLVVEYYLEQYLTAANPALGDVSEARLSFAQKLELARVQPGVAAFLYPALKVLNSSRNRLAHNIQAVVTDEDLKELRRYVEPWNSAAGRPVPNGVELVHEFALMASGLLSSAARAIERHGAGKGYRVYEEWMKDAFSQSNF